jgi:hypothetical protein
LVYLYTHYKLLIYELEAEMLY